MTHLFKLVSYKCKKAMITSNVIKNLATHLGADLCGIASIDRFENAPKGFHPQDVFKNTKSVISIACRILDGPLNADNIIPYSAIEEMILSKINGITLALSLAIEDNGSKAVIIPSTPYDYWDEENMEGRGILSLKHLAYFAGLGYMGRNTLLCNPKYGNLIKLGAIITDAELEADAIQEGEMCEPNCSLCVDSCPVEAIENNQVIQKICRPHSEIKNKRGVEIYACNICRKACPNRNGIEVAL